LRAGLCQPNNDACYSFLTIARPRISGGDPVDEIRVTGTSSTERGSIEGASVIVVATTDTASEALIKVIDARSQYRRAWVTDERGRDADLPQLNALVEEERKNP
jgi:hypothetical protein